MIYAEQRACSKGGAEIAAMAAILDAGYGAIGGLRAGPVAISKAPVRRCRRCGLSEGFDGRLHCDCELFGRLLGRTLAALHGEAGVRRFAEGMLVEGGLTAAWENSTANRDVDDEEPIPGLYEIDFRFSRILTETEVENIARQAVGVLNPCEVEVERSPSGREPWTCLRLTVDLLDRRVPAAPVCPEPGYNGGCFGPEA